MSFDGLTNGTLNAIELHRAPDFKRARVRRVARNTNEDHPLLICGDAVVDDLRARESCMTVEYLVRRACRVRDRPVVNGSIGHHPNRAVRYPFPEHDVLAIYVRLHFLLRLNVEYLQCATG